MTAMAISGPQVWFQCSHMWPRVATQNWTLEGYEMAKKKPRRARIPIHITLSPQVIEMLDKATYNRSRFIEDAILTRLSLGGSVLKSGEGLWSRDRDLNPGPADYESAALPS